MATRERVRLDNGYFNAFMPVRGRMGNYSSEMMGGSLLLTQNILESMYIHNGFARLVCDKPAEEMTRAGFKIVGMDEDAITDIEARFEELEIMSKLNEALKWRRAFGGGLIVLGIKDGGSLDKPVNEESIEGLDFLRVYNRFEAYPSKYYDNPRDSKFGEIELWKITSAANGVSLPSYEVHESRVLVFDGESVPKSIRASNNGWGASVLQTAFIQLTRLDASYKWALLLLERNQQAVHGIPNLSDQIATSEGEQQVTKRIAVVDRVRGALNTVVIDAEETYEVKNASVTGVNDIVDRMLRAVSAVTGVPAYLLGENITGMNSGSSNKEGWLSQVEAWQNDHLKRPLDRLVSLIRLGFTGGETDGDDYTLEFNPLFTPSDTDNAAIKKQQADTFNIYLTNGVMDSDEVRDIVRDEYNLVGDAPEPEPEPDPEPMVLNPGQQVVSHPNAQTPPKPSKVLAKGAPLPKKSAGKK